jgi:hypothetical protein
VTTLRYEVRAYRTNRGRAGVPEFFRVVDVATRKPVASGFRSKSAADQHAGRLTISRNALARSSHEGSADCVLRGTWRPKIGEPSLGDLFMRIKYHPAKVTDGDAYVVWRNVVELAHAGRVVLRRRPRGTSPGLLT